MRKGRQGGDAPVDVHPLGARTLSTEPAVPNRPKRMHERLLRLEGRRQALEDALERVRKLCRRGTGARGQSFLHGIKTLSRLRG